MDREASEIILQAKSFLEVIPRAMRVIRAEMRRAAGAEFTVPQFRILIHLSREPASNRELADWMGVSAPTMSVMIDKLVSRGLVQRDSTSDDRRQIRLCATKKGSAKAAQARAMVQEKLAARFAGLPDHKRRQLESGLGVLRELLF